MADARVVQVLERLARCLLGGEKLLARGLAQLAGARCVAGELEARTEQRPRGAEARGIRVFGVDRAPVGGERGVVSRSARVVLDKLEGSDDDAVKECLCHDGDRLGCGLRRPEGRLRLGQGS